MPALAELEAAWLAARADAGYREELGRLQRDFCGRPTPLYHAERLSEAAGRPGLAQARGPDAHGLAQAQQRARPVPARQADGQAADHRRDRRRPARRRDRDRVRAARPGVRRLHGHGGHAPPDAQRPAHAAARRDRRGVDAGSRTLKEAVSAAIRDWVANVGDTHYAIGSCVGPAPFPALVRDLQRIIGDEARAQVLERLRAAAVARDRLRRRRLQRDRHVRPVRRRRRGRARRRRGGGGGARHRPPRRAAHRRRPRRRAARLLLGDHAGRGRARSPRRTRSPPASTTPASGPEHAWLRDSGRARYDAVTDDQALDAFRRLAELEGIIPALESSHAVAWVLANPPGARRPARARLPVRPRRQGPRRGAGAAAR